MGLNSIISSARQKHRSEELLFEQEQKRKEQEHEERVKMFNKLVLGKLQKTTAKDYNAWLRGYLTRGGVITHSYDYPTEQWDWYIVLADFEILPLYGAESLNLIVPRGIKCMGGERGHTNLFYMDGFTTIGNFAPIFSDTNLEE